MCFGSQMNHLIDPGIMFNPTFLSVCISTALLAKGDSDIMFCLHLHSYRGLKIDRSLVY